VKRGEPITRAYFLTKYWRTRGVVEIIGYLGESGYITNHGITGVHIRDCFFGKLGGSVFETRDAAVESMKKKATAAAKRMRKELARIESIAATENVP
jgi:hypothetical protein